MDQSAKAKPRTENRDGMCITWHEPIEMEDGAVLRADLFRPIEEGRYPVILSYGPYAKGVSYQEGYSHQWQKMIEEHPDVLETSTNKYQNWETTDPERWVPHGYVIVRIDSRGAGWSPGFMEVFAPREYEDIYQCIEWAGTQEWSNGNVGMLGVSYYAINQWKVASMNPPHLAAIIPWEGNNDHYRDGAYHGGILNQFTELWSKVQIANIQYGKGKEALKNPNTGESVAGPVSLDPDTLANNRLNYFEQTKNHPLDDEWHKERTADLAKIKIPLLSCANWGGQGIHPRGNINGFLEASSSQKWLEIHGHSHWALFSTNYGLELQKKFFDHFLKGNDNGWEKTPKVMLNIRHPGPVFVRRDEFEWPIARTKWTKFYLDLDNKTLSPKPIIEVSKLKYDGLGDGVTFWLPPLEKEMEITGPMASKLFISSSTIDADLFLIVRVFEPNGEELTFMGSTDPNTPIANGWLRASHRALDLKKTKPHRPYHPHDRIEPLEPNEVYECDIEILQSCIVVPAGWRIALTIRGKDYEYEGKLSSFAKNFHYGTRGTGGMTHNDPDNRPNSIFDNQVTLHSDANKNPYLLLPIIPSK